MNTIRKIATLYFLLFLSWSALAQEEIAKITFDSVPGGTRLTNGGGPPIELQGDSTVTGNLSSSGEVATATGFRFPDGSIQLTAAGPGIGVTANAGLYGNTIVDTSPPMAYTEICFKDGDISADIHAGGEPTAGGNCLPGDIGWIIERFERDTGVATSWTSARSTCLTDGMRLPEPYEWIFSCEVAALHAISSMTDDWEWASNAVTMSRRSYDSSPDFVSLIIPVMGSGACTFGHEGVLARNDGVESTFVFRCVR